MAFSPQLRDKKLGVGRTGNEAIVVHMVTTSPLELVKEVEFATSRIASDTEHLCVWQDHGNPKVRISTEVTTFIPSW